VLSCDGNAGRVRGQVMFIYVCVCVGNLYTRMYVCVCVLSLSLARSLSLSLSYDKFTKRDFVAEKTTQRKNRKKVWNSSYEKWKDLQNLRDPFK
jgi:hypothetical protein